MSRIPPASALVVAMSVVSGVPAQTPLGEGFAARIRPLLEDSCFDCHAGAEPEAGLDLSRLADREDPVERFELLRRIRDRVHGREMPPSDWGELEDAEVATLSGWAHRELLELARPIRPDPGRVTVRRLTRAEYDNTVRDLLGVGTEVSATFPAADLGYGFDNIGDARTLATLHLEKYAAAAADIARQVVDLADPDHPTEHRLELELVAGEDGTRAAGELASFYTSATLRHDVELPRPGVYRLRVRASGDQAGGEPVRVDLEVDGALVERFEVTEPRRRPEVFEFTARIDARGGHRSGVHRVGVTFLNDYYNPQAEDRSQRDRNLYVDWVEVIGPVDPSPIPDGARWFVALDPRRGPPGARARPMLRELVRRAWRRPPRSGEVDRLSRLVETRVADGDPFPLALRTAVEAILVSPNFLFRIERTAAGRGRESPRALNGFELATRLSYFLWSSMPDRRLSSVARQGLLRYEAVLEREARRMLGHARIRALSEGFASQWLELRSLEEVAPDPERFGAFDDRLRRSMRTETEMLFDAVLREERPVTELLTADYTFVDRELARHYGVSDARGGGTGAAFRRVDLPPERRAGVLAHASVLTVTSNPTRTSPVKRGKWILENILDAPPAPPPPDAGRLEGDSREITAAGLRERLEQHREKASCAVCHTRMDALGFSLEHFDAIGAYRTEDRGTPVDAAAELPGGRRIEGATELARAIAGDPAFVRCVLRKLFVYAVGRDTTTHDLIALEVLAADLPPAPTLIDLILGIVRLDAFRMVRVE